MRDTCVVGREHHVEVDALWAVWKTWCENDNRKPGTNAVFGRDLRAAAPRVKKTRPTEDNNRINVYEGIAYNPPQRDNNELALRLL